MTRPAVPKEHDRCGSNLIAPMMLLSAGGTVLLERLVQSPGPLARAGVGLGGASLAVEMFAWSDRHHDTPAPRPSTRPAARSSACWRPRSRAPSSSRSGSPRWPRSFASSGRQMAASPLRPRRLRPCSQGSTTSASQSRTSMPAIALYGQSFEMEARTSRDGRLPGRRGGSARRRRGPRRAAGAARTRHRGRQVPCPQGPGPSPRRLRGRRHRRDPGAGARRRDRADRRRAADRNPRQPRRLSAPALRPAGS